MPLLSLIVITRNEERNLPRMLASVPFADEIVVCDSHSSDRTLEIAREYGCKIIVSEFIGFGPAKQAALRQATGDWVLSLDADEELDDELQTAIQAAIRRDDRAGYLLNRKSRFLGRWIMHSGWYPDWILRLFRREQGYFDQAPVHETVQLQGKIGRLSGHLLHHTDPDISHYLAKMDRYTTLAAQSAHQAERRFRLWDLILKPCAIFLKMLLVKRGFRDGVHGLILAWVSSFHVFCKYAKLWEMQKR